MLSLHFCSVSASLDKGWLCCSQTAVSLRLGRLDHTRARLCRLLQTTWQFKMWFLPPRNKPARGLRACLFIRRCMNPAQNKTRHFLFSHRTVGHPACTVAQVEVTVFMLQVNKAAVALIQPSFCKYTAVAEHWASGGERGGDLATPNQSLTDYC